MQNGWIELDNGSAIVWITKTISAFSKWTLSSKQLALETGGRAIWTYTDYSPWTTHTLHGADEGRTLASEQLVLLDTFKSFNFVCSALSIWDTRKRCIQRPSHRLYHHSPSEAYKPRQKRSLWRTGSLQQTEHTPCKSFLRHWHSRTSIMSPSHQIKKVRQSKLTHRSILQRLAENVDLHDIYQYEHIPVPLEGCSQVRSRSGWHNKRE